MAGRLLGAIVVIGLATATLPPLAVRADPAALPPALQFPSIDAPANAGSGDAGRGNEGDDSNGAGPEGAATQALSALRETKSYRQSVFGTAQRTAVWVQNKCADAKAALGSAIGILRDPVFDDKGVAQSGAWSEQVLVEGCGVQRQLNVLLGVSKPGQITAAPLLPGTTRADPVLQKDGTKFALNAASIGTKACQPSYVYDTTFVGPSTATPIVPDRPGWSERWTIAQCDQRIPVTIEFTPDTTGMAVAAKRDATPPAK